MSAALLRTAIKRMDELIDLVCAQANAMQGDEREALLREILASTAGSATAVIAMLAEGDPRLSAELTEVVSLQMTQSVAKHAPAIRAALQAAKP